MIMSTRLRRASNCSYSGIEISISHLQFYTFQYVTLSPVWETYACVCFQTTCRWSRIPQNSVQIHLNKAIKAKLNFLPYTPIKTGSGLIKKPTHFKNRLSYYDTYVMYIWIMHRYKCEYNECVFVNMLKVRVQTEVERAKGRGDEILLMGTWGIKAPYLGGLGVSSVFLHGDFEVS